MEPTYKSNFNLSTSKENIPINWSILTLHRSENANEYAEDEEEATSAPQ